MSITSRNYEALSVALWKHTGQNLNTQDLARVLGTRSQRIRDWEKGVTPIRSSVWCVLARKHKIALQDLAAVVLAPRTAHKLPTPFTARGAQVGYLGPLLRQLRGDRTLAEVQSLLGLKTWGTYHHWETGKRDIPFPKLLQAIDVFGLRIQSFCEAMRFSRSLDEFGFQSGKPDFSEKFFSCPWTPTVFLAIQTESYLNQKRHDERKLAAQLKFTLEQVAQALTILADLEMVIFDGKLFRARQGQFYAPPTLTPAKLEQLYSYWFSRSPDLHKQPGLHKIEEHALSRESLKKITGWVAELREKIREEVDKSKPETVVHIHWQVADMLPES